MREFKIMALMSNTPITLYYEPGGDRRTPVTVLIDRRAPIRDASDTSSSARVT